MIDRRRPRLPISCQEAFGPVVAVYPYDDLDAALAEVNDSDYGLQAGSSPTIWPRPSGPSSASRSAG